MGKLEKKAREWKKGDVQKAMLAALGIAGLLALTAVAPNTLQLLRYVPGNRYRFGRYARSAASRLVAKGQAVWVEENGKKFLRITAKGERDLAFEQAKVALATRKKKRWDEKWRMVVFDVPERRRRVRGRLRDVCFGDAGKQGSGSEGRRSRHATYRWRATLASRSNRCLAGA